MLTIFAVDPFVVDLGAMGAAVAGGLSFGRIAFVVAMLLSGLGLVYREKLAAAWNEAKATANQKPSAGEVTLNVAMVATLDDDCSRGFAFARSLDEIFERQGVSFEIRRQRFMDAVESVSPFGVVSPPVPVEAAKGGAA